MSKSNRSTAVSISRNWQYRFGVRWLFAMVLLGAIVFGWIGREYQRAERQSALVTALGLIDVRVRLWEPTGFGQLFRKLLPGREPWVREQVGEAWLSHPTVFWSWQLTDDQVPYVVDRIRDLDTVREVHLYSQQLSPRGVSAMQIGLPGVRVASANNPAMAQYYNNQLAHEQFAFAGVKLVALLAIGLLGILAIFAWPFVKSRRQDSCGRDPNQQVV